MYRGQYFYDVYRNILELTGSRNAENSADFLSDVGKTSRCKFSEKQTFALFALSVSGGLPFCHFVGVETSS